MDLQFQSFLNWLLLKKWRTQHIVVRPFIAPRIYWFEDLQKPPPFFHYIHWKIYNFNALIITIIAARNDTPSIAFLI